MAFAVEPTSEPVYEFLHVIYKEAFHRMGWEFEYILYPLARASIMADDGKVDGEPQRMFNYGEAFPNLIRVEEPIFTNVVIAYGTNPSIKLDTWESLIDTPYRVEHIIGSLRAADQLALLIKPELLSSVETEDQALKKLILGRTDIFIDIQSRVYRKLQSAEFVNSGIIQVGILETSFFYPYVHKKHAILAEELAKMIRRLKSEGFYESQFNRILPGLLLK